MTRWRTNWIPVFDDQGMTTYIGQIVEDFDPRTGALLPDEPAPQAPVDPEVER